MFLAISAVNAMRAKNVYKPQTNNAGANTSHHEIVINLNTFKTINII